jgi:hypothetical protein
MRCIIYNLPPLRPCWLTCARRGGQGAVFFFYPFVFIMTLFVLPLTIAIIMVCAARPRAAPARGPAPSALLAILLWEDGEGGIQKIRR